MIFKTFNSDIDNMSSRWGMFGKSFSDIGNTITTKRKQVTDYVAVTNDATISGMMSAWKGTSPVLSTFLRILSIPDFRFLTLPGSLSSVSNMWCQEEVFPLHYAFRNGHE